MSKMSHINVIEKYEEHRVAILKIILKSVWAQIEATGLITCYGNTRKQHEKGA